MKIDRYKKASFSVIGKEGSTFDGKDFIQRLWEQANSRFDEVEHLAKCDAQGNIVGVWGLMSDLSRSFRPWEDRLTKGLYLAGIECRDNAEPPEGWTKWTVPGYEYIIAECENDNTFTEVIDFMYRNRIPLAGAVHDFTSPETGKDYKLFPVRRL